MAKLKPLSDNVLIKRFDSQGITAGGIHVPETSQSKTQTGEIIAVGTGRRLKDGEVQPLVVAVGDKVIFGKFSGTDVEVAGEEFLMLRESELLGIVEQ